MIHTVKCFSIVNKIEVDFFWISLGFLYVPTNVGSLISGSSASSKPSCTSGSSRFMYCWSLSSVQFSRSVMSDSASPRTAAHQASLSITNSWSLLKHRSIESVMPSNHLILCLPYLLLPSIFPSIRVFSKESAFCTRWPKYWSFSFSISPSNEYSGLISFRIYILTCKLIFST